jgi:hypothetical protein
MWYHTEGVALHMVAVLEPKNSGAANSAADHAVSPFPYEPTKALVWAVLQQARTDAAVLGEGKKLHYTAQVTSQAVDDRREELRDWLWCRRFHEWMSVFEWSAREIDSVSDEIDRICCGDAEGAGNG